jgi:hypothetical protein
VGAIVEIDDLPDRRKPKLWHRRRCPLRIAANRWDGGDAGVFAHDTTSSCRTARAMLLVSAYVGCARNRDKSP